MRFPSAGLPEQRHWQNFALHHRCGFTKAPSLQTWLCFLIRPAPTPLPFSERGFSSVFRILSFCYVSPKRSLAGIVEWATQSSQG